MVLVAQSHVPVYAGRDGHGLNAHLDGVERMAHEHQARAASAASNRSLEERLSTTHRVNRSMYVCECERVDGGWNTGAREQQQATKQLRQSIKRETSDSQPPPENGNVVTSGRALQSKAPRASTFATWHVPCAWCFLASVHCRESRLCCAVL